MDISIFLAKLLGLYMLIGGASVVLNIKELSRAVRNMSKNYIELYFLGFFVLLFGLILVLLHNIWMPDWRMIVTIIAWLILLKGVLLVWMPSKFLNFINHLLRIDSAYTASGIVMILIGFYLVSIGF